MKNSLWKHFIDKYKKNNSVFFYSEWTGRGEIRESDFRKYYKVKTEITWSGTM